MANIQQLLALMKKHQGKDDQEGISLRKSLNGHLQQLLTGIKIYTANDVGHHMYVGDVVLYFQNGHWSRMSKKPSIDSRFPGGLDHQEGYPKKHFPDGPPE